MSWSESPIVSFARNGEELVLGRSGRDATLHLHGSEGLGIAPVQFSKSDRLSGDGSVVRNVRYGDREVYIPMRVHLATMAELTDWRRGFMRMLAPSPGDVQGSFVDVRVQDPATGSDRTIRGLYKDGLAGDFGSDFLGRYQAFGITLECPDPWWVGPEHVTTLRISPGVKAFLSTSVPFFPVMLAQSTVIGRFDVTVVGDGPVDPVWEIVGPGTDLVISNGSSVFELRGTIRAGEVIRLDAGAQRIIPDRWQDVSTRSRLFKLPTGRTSLRVTMVGATADTLVRLTYRERYREGI